MEKHQLSKIQVANLYMLTTLVEYVKEDSILACGQFAIDMQQIDALSKLSFHSMMELIAHMDNESLFLPRADLVSILQCPPPLLGTMLTVRPPPPSKPPERM